MASSSADAGRPVRLRLLDTTVTVRRDDPAAGEVRRLYAPFLTGTGCPDRDDGSDGVGGSDGIGPGWHTLGVKRGLSEFAAEVNALVLAEVRCLAVHAGAVARGDAVVAFPGPSGAGKTTLAAACLRAGLDYVSDEALCLDWHDAAVRPYPRPLALSPWSAAAVGLSVAGGAVELLATAADLGASVAVEPLRLAHVVLLEPFGGPPGLRPAPRSAAATELLRRSFTHWHRPGRAFELVHEALRHATVWRLSPSTPHADATTLSTLLPP